MQIWYMLEEYNTYERKFSSHEKWSVLHLLHSDIKNFYLLKKYIIVSFFFVHKHFVYLIILTIMKCLAFSIRLMFASPTKYSSCWAEGSIDNRFDLFFFPCLTITKWYSDVRHLKLKAHNAACLVIIVTSLLRNKKKKKK